MLRLMQVATKHVDYFMLEVPEPSLVQDLDEEDELTRPEMEDAGFKVALADVPGHAPNPLTNELHFMLDVWADQKRRTLFNYKNWTSWPHPTLVALAKLLDLNCMYFEANDEQFAPVSEGVHDEDILDNVTFMMFTRHPFP